MTDYEIFSKSPIIEALIDIQCVLPSDTSLDVLGAFQEAVRDRFPERKERSAWQLGVEFLPNPSPPNLISSGGVNGYILESDDGRHILQIRLNGFSLSRLKPYESWKTFAGQATGLWDLYRQFAKPDKVKRLAVRYVNRLELPLPVDFQEYLLTTPEIGPGLPQGLSSYFMRLLIPHPDIDGVAVVTQALESLTVDSKIASVLLDLDVFQQNDFDPGDSESIWSTLDRLRWAAYNLFTKSITEKTKDLIR